jgi:ketosteroid isomerase-like protein
MDEFKLQYLLDRQEISDVVHRYARGLDRHDDEVLRSVFHEDAVDNHGPWVGGREAFVAWANGPCHEHTSAHVHHISTHNVEIDGDVAHAESYCQWVHRLKDERTVTVGGGRYVDRLEKRDGAWRIVVRRLVLDYSFEAEGTVFGSETQRDYPKGTWSTDDPSYERPLQIPVEVMAQRVD